MKIRLMRLFAGLLAVFGMNACLQNESVMTLRKDGSGTLVEETMMGAQMVAMMEQMAAMGGAEAQAGAQDPLKEMYDEAKYKAAAAGYGEGVEFVGLEKVARDGGKGVKVTYKFADINKLKFTPGGSLKEMGGEGAEAAAAEEEPVTFAYKDGKLAIKFADPKKPEGAPEAEMPDENDPQAAMATAMLKDMRISARLVVEPGIAKTDATYAKDNTITLMDVRFGELLANPGGMKAMKKLETNDRAALAETVKSLKGIELETKKEVSVELK